MGSYKLDLGAFVSVSGRHMGYPRAEKSSGTVWEKSSTNGLHRHDYRIQKIHFFGESLVRRIERYV